MAMETFVVIQKAGWHHIWKLISNNRNIPQIRHTLLAIIPFVQLAFYKIIHSMMGVRPRLHWKCVGDIRCHLKQVSCIPLELFPSFFSVSQWMAWNLFQMTSDAIHTFQCNRGLKFCQHVLWDNTRSWLIKKGSITVETIFCSLPFFQFPLFNNFGCTIALKLSVVVVGEVTNGHWILKILARLISENFPGHS